MFGEIYLAQISASNLLFNLRIPICLIASVLCEVNMSSSNIFITDKDTKHRDKLEIYLIEVISKANSISNLIMHNSLQLIDNIGHSGKSIPIVQIYHDIISIE